MTDTVVNNLTRHTIIQLPNVPYMSFLAKNYKFDDLSLYVAKRLYTSAKRDHIETDMEKLPLHVQGLLRDYIESTANIYNTQYAPQQHITFNTVYDIDNGVDSLFIMFHDATINGVITNVEAMCEHDILESLPGPVLTFIEQAMMLLDQANNHINKQISEIANRPECIIDDLNRRFPKTDK